MEQTQNLLSADMGPEIISSQCALFKRSCMHLARDAWAATTSACWRNFKYWMEPSRGFKVQWLSNLAFGACVGQNTAVDIPDRYLRKYPYGISERHHLYQNLVWDINLYLYINIYSYRGLPLHMYAYT